jgi:porin
VARHLIVNDRTGLRLLRVFRVPLELVCCIALLLIFSSLGFAADDDTHGTSALSLTSPSAAIAPSGAQSVLLSRLMSLGSEQALSGNPAAVNVRSGLGLLTSLTGLDKLGVFVGGLWVGNGDYILTGGTDPHSWNFNSLLVLDGQVDTSVVLGLPGGTFGVSYLKFNGQPSNNAAGSVIGYDGLTQAPPLEHNELYQLWWRQSLFANKLIVRVGKVVPTYAFNNVIQPVPVQVESASIPAVTAMIYSPIFVNSTILGNLPGYYNSAYGVTTTIAPTKQVYFSYGVYDGNLAHGVQTGLNETPDFSGYYFQIGQVGYDWLLGAERMPGNVGLGGWGQTGRLMAGSGTSIVSEDGVGGFYTFGAQRLWFRHPSIDNSGISGYWQFGINDSATMLADKYFGLGLTGFGLVPERPADSIGTGLAWSWLNHPPGSGRRSQEVMLAFYYQLHIISGIFFQPTLTYLPDPGVSTNTPGTAALTLQMTVLF